MATRLVDNPVDREAFRDTAASRARKRLALRALGGFPGVAQVWFDAAVLDRYRHVQSFSIKRTDTVGRVRGASWRLDFGIGLPGKETAFQRPSPDAQGEGGAVIHASIGDLVTQLPEAEREHWASYVVMPGASTNFLLMQATKGACIDDGDTRDW
jgi:hypothetical protein